MKTPLFILALLFTGIIFSQNNLHIVNTSAMSSDNMENNTGEIFVVYNFAGGNSNKEIEVPKKPIIVNQPKVEPKKEEIKQEVKVEAPTIKEETKVENVDTTNSSKKIYTIPTYLTKDLNKK